MKFFKNFCAVTMALVVLALPVMFVADNASAQDAFGQETVTVLLPPQYCGATTIGASVDVSQYQGICRLLLMGTNVVTTSTTTVICVSTNQLTSSATSLGPFTNSFLVVNGPTNDVQSLLFDTRTNGTKAQIQVTSTGISNFTGVVIIGTLKNQ